jgi:hypothetical protein
MLQANQPHSTAESSPLVLHVLLLQVGLDQPPSLPHVRPAPATKGGAGSIDGQCKCVACWRAEELASATSHKGHIAASKSFVIQA